MTFITRDNFKGTGIPKVGGERVRNQMNTFYCCFYRKGARGYGEAKNGHAKEAGWRV